MSSTQVEVQGTLRPDGTVQLSQPVDPPLGPVRVILQSLEETAASPDRFWSMLDEIWAGQRARGHQPRSKEEIDAEIDALRHDADEEFLQNQRVQSECQQSPPSARRASRGGRIGERA